MYSITAEQLKTLATIKQQITTVTGKKLNDYDVGVVVRVGNVLKHVESGRLVVVVDIVVQKNDSTRVWLINIDEDGDPTKDAVYTYLENIIEGSYKVIAEDYLSNDLHRIGDIKRQIEELQKELAKLTGGN